MEMSHYVGILLGIMFLLKWALKNVNKWIYERNLGKKKRECLPPGDFGWPFIGNMWSFLRAFKSNDPNTFISNIVERFGSRGFYKSFMFGNPSIIVTDPETCRRVLSDDNTFKTGWPDSIIKLAGRKSFIAISYEQHKRLRKLTTAPINGHEALSIYMQYIETNVVSALERWSKLDRIELLTELQKLAFQIIMHIFLSSETEHMITTLEKEYVAFNYGFRAMGINIPGFAYYEALKARKKLTANLQVLVSARRKKREAAAGMMSKKDMLDALLDTEDENGRKLDDEEIVDTLVNYLNAGHESSGHIMMWSTVFLQAHPEFLQIAKEEQERIVKNMPPGQNGLTLKDIRQMEYLSKVINETLRIVSFSFMAFRETKKDVDIKGYFIPKGWKVLLWYRSIHHNPEIYPQPNKFDPSRWDDHVRPKSGTFLPFGGGTRLCPGNELAKLEISIFLHHFLLNYKFERENPGCPQIYLPHPKPKDN